MSLPMSKTRWVDLAQLAEAPLHRAHHLAHVLQLLLARPLPTWPICAVIWAENCCELLPHGGRASRACACLRLGPRRLDLALEEEQRPGRARRRLASSSPSRAATRQSSAPARSPPRRRGRRRRRRPRRITPRPGSAAARASGGRPGGARTARTRAASRRFRHWPDMRLWQSAKSYFTGSSGSRRAEPRRDLLGHLPVAAAPAREADRARHVLDVRVDRDEERRRRHARPEPEVGRLPPDHPAEEEVQALARPAGGRAREPVRDSRRRAGCAGRPPRGPAPTKPSTKRSSAGPTCGRSRASSPARRRPRASRGSLRTRWAARQKASDVARRG